MKKGWTTTKLASIGGLAVLDVVLRLMGAGIQAVTGFVGAGGIINSFLTPIMAMICLFVIDQFGAATVMFTVLGILELPFPLTGTPGFFPKVFVLTIAGIIADTMYFFLKRDKKVSSLIIGSVLTLYLAFAIVGVGRLFKLPGIGWTAKMFHSPFVLLLSVLIGALGGYFGYIIYGKIKNTSVVKRIQG